jgi:hypothetical protein
MSFTAYGVNDPEARKAWQKIVAVEALQKTYIGQFIGKSDDALIQQKNELSKDKGDSVRFFLRAQLTGRGVQGDTQLKGNEEKLATYSDNVLIDQRRHAANAGGKMTRQRVPFDTRRECMDGLSDWAADLMDYSFFNQIAGNTNETDTLYTGNNSATAPTRVIRKATLTTDQAVQADTTATFDTSYIDKAKVEATANPVGTPNLRPSRSRAATSSSCSFTRSRSTNSANRRRRRAAGRTSRRPRCRAARSPTTRSTRARSASGTTSILHEAFRIPNGIHSTTGALQTSTRRAVLCGAQAVASPSGRATASRSSTGSKTSTTTKTNCRSAAVRSSA